MVPPGLFVRQHVLWRAAGGTCAAAAAAAAALPPPPPPPLLPSASKAPTRLSGHTARLPSQVERALDVARQKAAGTGLPLEVLQQDLLGPLQGELQASALLAGWFWSCSSVASGPCCSRLLQQGLIGQRQAEHRGMRPHRLQFMPRPPLAPCPGQKSESRRTASLTYCWTQTCTTASAPDQSAMLTWQT